METASKIYVERLQEKDKFWVINTAAVRMLCEELKCPHYVNIPDIAALVEHAFQEGTIRIAKIGEDCVGVVGGLVVQNPFNKQITTLTEVFFYVLPKYRDTKAALLLLNAYTQMAAEIADEATFSILEGSPMGDRVLNKRGFKLLERAYKGEF